MTPVLITLISVNCAWQLEHSIEWTYGSQDKNSNWHVVCAHTLIANLIETNRSNEHLNIFNTYISKYNSALRFIPEVHNINIEILNKHSIIAVMIQVHRKVTCSSWIQQTCIHQKFFAVLLATDWNFSVKCGTNIFSLYLWRLYIRVRSLWHWIIFKKWWNCRIFSETTPAILAS